MSLGHVKLAFAIGAMLAFAGSIAYAQDVTAPIPDSSYGDSANSYQSPTDLPMPAPDDLASTRANFGAPLISRASAPEFGELLGKGSALVVTGSSGGRTRRQIHQIAAECVAGVAVREDGFDSAAAGA